MRKVFFVIEKNITGGIVSCLYYDFIPTCFKSRYVWGMRLDILEEDKREKFMNKSLKEMHEIYLQFSELGSLPNSNIISGDYIQSSKG
jgi:hypothetical protein